MKSVALEKMCDVMDSEFKGIGSHFRGVFRFMEIAEEEIKKVKKKNKNADLSLAFSLLVPTKTLYVENGNLCPEQVYRGHCREILERMTKEKKFKNGRDDVHVPTFAECLIVLSGLSFNAPLRRNYADLMSICFIYCYEGTNNEALETMKENVRYRRNEISGEFIPNELDSAYLETINAISRKQGKRGV